MMESGKNQEQEKNRCENGLKKLAVSCIVEVNEYWRDLILWNTILIYTPSEDVIPVSLPHE